MCCVPTFNKYYVSTFVRHACFDSPFKQTIHLKPRFPRAIVVLRVLNKTCFELLSTHDMSNSHASNLLRKKQCSESSCSSPWQNVFPRTTTTSRFHAFYIKNKYFWNLYLQKLSFFCGSRGTHLLNSLVTHALLQIVCQFSSVTTHVFKCWVAEALDIIDGWFLQVRKCSMRCWHACFDFSSKTSSFEINISEIFCFLWVTSNKPFQSPGKNAF